MVNDRVVHVIDDDEAVRDSIAFLLSTAGLRSKTYVSAADFLARFAEAEPGCILTDVRMPEITGLELMEKLAGLGADLPVVVMTGHGDVPLAVEAMKNGAIDFIEKPFDDDVLLAALKAGLDHAESRQSRSEERALIAGRLAQLSTRERQVLDGIVAGSANKVIAYDLGISPRTVEVYRANLMTKMRAQNLSELVRMTLLVDSSR